MRNKRQVSLGPEINASLGGRGTGVVCMNNQFSVSLTSELFGYLRKLCKHRWAIIIRIELLSFWEDLDFAKSIGVPRKCHHQFLTVAHMTLSSFGRLISGHPLLFTGWMHLEERLIKDSEILPRNVFR
jgi:hypothetical protein